MKSTRLATLCAALGLFSVLSVSSRADIYNDATNDLFDNGFSNLDITSVEVTNNATTITFNVTTRAFQNWTKYLIWIDTPGRTNAPANNNGWGRPANLASGEGADFFIGSWVDAITNNIQLWNWNGTLWAGPASYTTVNSGNTVSYTIPLSTLGLSAGNVIKFDVATSGGGNDPGVDHASRNTSATTGWGSPSTGGPMLSYTIEGVPDFDGDGTPDATDTDDDNDGLPDTVETGTGAWVSSSDTGTLPKNADTDGDGLNDGVETNTGAYVDVTNTGSNPVVPDDFDRDLLPDFHDPDDDNDTLADTVETNTNIWVSSSNTGTNPKNADTDGDGLRDDVETNTGSYASATNTGTSPLVADQQNVFIAGNEVLFPGATWQVNNSTNRMAPIVGGAYATKTTTKFVSAPGLALFKFTAGVMDDLGAEWGLNWGVGLNTLPLTFTNQPTEKNPSLQAKSPRPLYKDRDTDPADRTSNLEVRFGRGEYTFTFDTGTLEFSVTRKSYTTLEEFVAAYGLTGANAAGSADPDEDLLNNEQEFALNTAPDRADTDGDGFSDSDESGATLGYVLNPLSRDSDNDDLLDDWELNNNLNPTSAAGDDGREADLDGDSLSNFEEQASGTSPWEANTSLSSNYSKFTVIGTFNNWNVPGDWQNTMRLVGFKEWKALIFISSNNLVATNGFKFAGFDLLGSKSGEWGRGPKPDTAVKEGFRELRGTMIDTNGYYEFGFNDVLGSFQVTKISGGPDTNSNGLPDAYEKWYGARLSSPVTALDPAGDPDGDGVTTADEFTAGSNPVQDVEPPTIQLLGDEVVVVPLNGTYTDPGATATDKSSVTLTTNSTVNPALTGIYPVSYVAVDAASNRTTNNSRRVVVGSWTAGYGGPIYYNLQTLGSGGAWGRNVTNHQAGAFEIYAQFYRQGATEGTNRTDPKASCWIGVTTNTNASATNDMTTSDWTWAPANLNADNTSPNDEYKATYTNLAPGTYQVVSRWQFDGGVYGYGGLNEDNQGGALGRTVAKVVGTGTNAVTNQIAYLPGSITVTAVSVGYAKIQFPTAPAPINAGDAFDVYIQFYSAGVTEVAGAPAWSGVRAQLGYGLTGGDPSVGGAYTWVDAAWNSQLTDLDANNDEYKATLTGLTAGTYFYACRFSVDGGVTWVYGGIGGVWNNDSAVLVVNAGGSTFTGWAGGATLDATNVGKYAIGGASSPTATDGVKPTSTVSGGNLVLTAIVRTDDAKLTVVGEAVTSLSDYAPGGTVASVSGVDTVDQTGVPAGHKRQTFTVAQGADSRKFLRLKATLAP